MTRYIYSNLIFNLLVSLDPHVRVAGRRDGVKVAKERVMEVLDTRVIMQFLNNTACVYVCVHRVAVEPELTSHGILFCVLSFLLRFTALQLHLFSCAFPYFLSALFVIAPLLTVAFQIKSK